MLNLSVSVSVQGNDPQTDLRGYGMLGLLQMLALIGAPCCSAPGERSIPCCGTVVFCVFCGSRTRVPTQPAPARPPDAAPAALCVPLAVSVAPPPLLTFAPISSHPPPPFLRVFQTTTRGTLSRSSASAATWCVFSSDPIRPRRLCRLTVKPALLIRESTAPLIALSLRCSLYQHNTIRHNRSRSSRSLLCPSTSPPSPSLPCERHVRA